MSKGGPVNNSVSEGNPVAGKIAAFVFGHSHVWSVRRALKLGWQHPDIKIRDIICGTKELPGSIVYHLANGEPQLNAVILAALHRVAAMDANAWLVSMVGGNDYNRLGMFSGSPSFDFVVDEDSQAGLAADAMVLPKAAVQEALKSKTETLSAYFPLLTQMAGHKRIIVIGTSPPNATDDLLVSHLEKAAKGTAITPARVRYKLWLIQNQLMLEHCQAAGIHFLKGDYPGTVDADGYTLKAFMKSDGIHLNEDHASILLDTVAGYIAERSNG
jgi:lysophospholipase L1-like esterase